MTTVSILHITMELVNTPTKQPYHINIHSLVNGLYIITTESIKLALDVEQFDASSDLIVPPPIYRKCHSFFFFFNTSSLRHFMDSTEMSLSIFGLEFTTKSKTSINNSMLFALPAA